MFSASIISKKNYDVPHELFERTIINYDSTSVFSGLMETVYDYVAVFDKNMTLTDCSKSCLDLLKSENNSMNFVKGKHFNVFAPDFKKRKLFKEFQIENDINGYFEQDSFPLHNPSIYSNTSYVRFKLIQCDPYIIYSAADITVNIQYDILKRKYLKLLAKNEHLEALLTSSKSEILMAENEQNHSKKSEIDLLKLLEKQNDFTEREIEVAMLIIEGMSTREIADVLYLSTKTIDFHRINIRKKLGITNSKKSLSSHLLSL